MNTQISKLQKCTNKILEKFPWKEFEDEFLLHQHCKIERRNKSNKKKGYIWTKNIQKSWNSHCKIIIKFEVAAQKYC